MSIWKSYNRQQEFVFNAEWNFNETISPVSSPRGTESSDGLLALADRPVGPIRLPEKRWHEFVVEFNQVYGRLRLQVAPNPAFACQSFHDPASAVSVVDVIPATEPNFRFSTFPLSGKSTLVDQLTRFLDETVHGSARAAFVVDRTLHPGLFESLRACSSKTASEIHQGTSVACHVRQISFSMEIAARAIRGDRFSGDWSWVWDQVTVDAIQWDELQSQLHDSYRFLHASLQALDISRADCVAAALQAMTQVSYHLGIVRQKMASF